MENRTPFALTPWIIAASRAQKSLWLGLIFAALAALPYSIRTGLLIHMRRSAIDKLPNIRQWDAIFRIVFAAAAVVLLLAALALYLSRNT
jgi:hypothetical protein